MPTLHIEQFGCRATQADAAAIEHQLLERGYTLADTRAGAEVVVVNTCTVTSSADMQARHAIRDIHRANPGARIIVTGCYAQRAPEEVAKLEGVAWVVGNSHKSEIPRLLDSSETFAARNRTSHSEFVPIAHLETETSVISQGPAKILSSSFLETGPWMATPVIGGENGHTRPILKIQDGCNNRCSYCVIPFVRGQSRSMPPGDIVAEIDKLCSAGFKEIIFSGINLGAYGRDLNPRMEFGDLLHQICHHTPLERLRISSIEPMDVTSDLIDLFASTDRIARHFHLPLQSGSDRMLAAMRRRYRAEHYARRVELIRERLPDAAIGADVIAGFPGETEFDHRVTLGFVERLPLTYLHVFSFSKRPGTTAAHLGEEVPSAAVRDRARELRALAQAKNAAFLASQMGRAFRVLTINHTAGHDTGGWTPAIASNYLRVRLPGEWPANQMINVRTVSQSGSFLTAEILDAGCASAAHSLQAAS